MIRVKAILCAEYRFFSRAAAGGSLDEIVVDESEWIAEVAVTEYYMLQEEHSTFRDWQLEGYKPRNYFIPITLRPRRGYTVGASKGTQT